ncbi:hypothetical protein [Salinicola endophyticus]|uniref:hypothetical protein n=1 Tax=Salinicola endophyticus TaxID=1949083 RepID=UPI000DA1A120|nr:hypothetical protein [Salinicola endophyticus]
MQSNATIRIDLTAKAQRLGLCPERHDVMVQMEQPLINEVAALFDSAASLHPALDQLHWIERLDAFLTEARQKLADAPSGARAFDFEVCAPHRSGALLLPLGVEVHAEIERLYDKHVLVFSLRGRDRLAA